MNIIEFPSYSNTHCNMMPIVMGNSNTIPSAFRGYIPLINKCSFKEGAIVYLSVAEDWVLAGSYQRRPGIHTDATKAFGWGGGNWGGAEGIYLASNDGACRVWEQDVTKDQVNSQGKLLEKPKGSLYQLQPNKLYHIGEYTPHESLPLWKNRHRQFFRLVGPKIGIWFSKHSTPSPFGIMPEAPISHYNKF